MAHTALTRERALAIWTELQRCVSVGAYLELEPDGSYPPDDGTPESATLESLAHLETWAQRQGLEFCWHEDSKTWTLEAMEQRSGECVECGRFSSSLSVNGSCEGCIMQAAIEAQERS